MSDDRRQSKPAQPNVLTGAATPNRLANEVARPVNVSTVTTAPKPRPADSVRPASVGTYVPAPIETYVPEAPTGGRRIPAVPSLVVLGFIVLTAVRLLGQVLGDDSSAPTVTGQPAPNATSTAPGSITFGTSQDDDCVIAGSATEFPAGTKVLWTADLARAQAADATVVVIVRRNGLEVERATVPPDTSVGTWSILCGGPFADASRGDYRVEVWSEDVKVMHAAGEYRLTAAP